MNLIKTILLAFLLYASPAIKAQALSYADTINILTQTWKFKEAHSDNIPEGDEDNEDFIKNSRFEFKKGGVFIGRLGTDAEKGKWEFKRQTNELLIQVGEEEAIALKIISLSAAMIKFKNEEDGLFASGTLIPVK